MSRIPLRTPVRINPFTGLVIDVDTWATAHDYHRRHFQLHLLALHGSGIAHGLEVLPTDPPSESLVIEEGVAIDSMGNVIVVPERHLLPLGAAEGTCYVVIDYLESLPPGTSAQSDTPTRVMEDFRMRVLQGLPEPPALELARVERSRSRERIIAAANPWTPGINEIDSRFRLKLKSDAPEELVVGIALAGPSESICPEHLLGLHYLIREMELNGLRARVTGPTIGSVPSGDLIYLTGNSEVAVEDSILRQIRERVSQGALLFADPCGAGTTMTQSISEAANLEADRDGATASLMLGSHFVFGEPPAGAVPDREVLWRTRSLISPRDYGCIWAGRRAKDVFQRDAIRSALEFGVNVGFGAVSQVSAR